MGAAGICVNARKELLMVREDIAGGESAWTVSAGGVEPGETLEQCVVREMAEETGYQVRILEKLRVKSGEYENLGIAYEVHYFQVEATGGEARLQDPDGLVREIAWKPLQEVMSLPLLYPEDRDYLIGRLIALVDNRL
jgi:aminoglycoside 6'-N-acetyltransferase